MDHATHTTTGSTEEPLYTEHGHLTSDDAEGILPAPIRNDLNSPVAACSLELSTILSPDMSISEESFVKETEERKASNVEDLQHKQVSEVMEGNVKSIEIWEPDQNDVLTGRGANINLHPGNQKFRALCYAHKAIFDVANPAAKKRIATEIWTTCQNLYHSRFLSKGSNIHGPWIQQNSQKAILKAAQTIRDYQRPDRMLDRSSTSRRKGVSDSDDHHPTDDSNSGLLPLPNNNNNKKRRIVKTATPMDHVMIQPPPQEPVYENPDGVETNDVLCGRGAFVNGHNGNKFLRELAMTRKRQFDAGNYTEKRKLATEIVTIIQQLQPPGRFLSLTTKDSSSTADTSLRHGPEGSWVEVGLDKAIIKACQVMRDIDRPDRKYRVDRKVARLNRLQALNRIEPCNDGVTDSSDNRLNVGNQDDQQICVFHDENKVHSQNHLEDHHKHIVSDSHKSINAIINDVVDSLDLPIESDRESV